MFTTEKHYTVAILSGGKKECVVRWPTDEEWATFFRRRKLVIKKLGGGRTVKERPDDERAADELLGKIRVDKGETLDSADAAAVLERLSLCELTDIQRAGDTFVIDMRVPGGEVRHVVSIPTERQKRKYERALPPPVESNRETVIRMSMEPGGELYDTCLKSTDGYTEGRVPLIHKAAVIGELLDAIERELAEEDPEILAPET